MGQNLADFKGIYGGTCWVCGTGPSLRNLMEGERHLLFPSIGMNAIGMDFFHPNYLVVVNKIYPNRQNPPYIAKRGNAIRETEAPYAFSRFDNFYTTAQWIPIEPLESLYENPPEYAFGRGRLFAWSTVTITGISLAIWMGFTRIGIIGFDLKGHLMQEYLPGINEACGKIMDYCKKSGIEIWNLSNQSLVEPFPRCTIEGFVE